MPLPAEWVDHLFAKLSIRYGAAFLRQYPDADPAIVKADWAEVLEGFDGAALSYGLRYLPSDRPVTAGQFRDICRRAPPPVVRRLPAPEEPQAPADPARVAAAVASALRPVEDGRTHAERVADRLRAMRSSGRRLTAAQLAMLKACTVGGSFTEHPGAFEPVPRHLWPEAMQREVMP